MIAKRIPKNPEIADSFKALALYIAEARDGGEKLEDFWIGNCGAGDGLDDLPAALAEVEAVRAMKPKTANKTYHLVVSFRPGERPGREQVREIGREFAHALGFEDHQWVAGTHRDTDNFHIHMAFNRVQPETLRVRSPWNDYRALERTCREMERRFGFQADRGMSDVGMSDVGMSDVGMSDLGMSVGGMSDGEERARPSGPARDFEARTWRQSFQGYVIEHKDEIMAVVERAKGWQDAHEGLAGLDLELKPRANGLVFKRRDGKETAKASLAGRSLSKAALEKRLGPYRGPEKPMRERPRRRRYTARPLTRHPAAARLWRAYLRPGNRNGRRSTFLGRLAMNWKQFLINEAYRDPLALVIIIMHREMMDLAFGPSPRVPKMVSPALRHWTGAGTWADGRKNPWLTVRKVKGFGLKEDGDGNLIIPFRDARGNIRALRCLAPDGKTLNIGDMRGPGLAHVIDPGKTLAASGDADRVVITDDYAAAAAIHTAARRAVVLVPPGADAGKRLEALKAEHPGVQAVLAGSPALNRQAASHQYAR